MFNRNKIEYLNIILMLCISTFSYSQINFEQSISIHTDGSNPDDSAILDLSSTEKGLLISRMTLAQRDAIVKPAHSLLIFQTNNNPGFYFNAGDSKTPIWQALEGGNGDLFSFQDSDGDTRIRLIEDDSDKIEFIVDGNNDVAIETDQMSNGKVSVGDGSSYQTDLKLDRLNFKGFGNNDVDGQIRNLNGQLFIQSFKDNFGISMIGKEAITLQVSDTSTAYFQMHNNGSFQMGLGSESFGRQSKLDLYHSSSNDNPHLTLLENEEGKASRLRFKNEHTPLLDWMIAAKLEADAEVFGIYLNGAEKMTYKTEDDVWNFNSAIKVISDKLVINPNGVQDGAHLYLRNSDGNDRIKMFTQPSLENEGGWISLFNGADTRTILLQAEDSQNGGRIHIAKSDGTENLKLDADWNSTGFSRIVTDELELNGGSDFAEYFNITSPEEEVRAGTVVCIHPSEPGKLIESNQSYDRNVAGVISGANGIRPGIMMGQDGTLANGSYPIALTGRVYVRANTESGDIAPGDMLTTSSTSGEAMKAENREKAYGTILGKAMTRIDKNGFVLVLVNLQ